MSIPVLSETYSCGRCKVDQPLVNYHRSTTLRGRHSICKTCRAKNHNIISEMLSNAKYRANRKGWDFDLTKEDIINMRTKQNNKCVFSGVELNWEASDKLVQRICPFDRVSLDRIDSTKGYTRDNVQLVTDFCNRIKAWYPEADILKFCQYVVENFKVQA